MCFCAHPTPPPPTAAAHGAVLPSAGCHAAPEGSAGAEDQADRGQHPATAGRAATDPAGAVQSAGTEPTGRDVPTLAFSLFAYLRYCPALDSRFRFVRIPRYIQTFSPPKLMSGKNILWN